MTDAKRELKNVTPNGKPACRIVSDGTAVGTVLENEYGDRIPGVRKITWSVGAKEGERLAKVTVELAAVGGDVSAAFDLVENIGNQKEG